MGLDASNSPRESQPSLEMKPRTKSPRNRSDLLNSVRPITPDSNPTAKYNDVSTISQQSSSSDTPKEVVVIKSTQLPPVSSSPTLPMPMPVLLQNTSDSPDKGVPHLAPGKDPASVAQFLIDNRAALKPPLLGDYLGSGDKQDAILMAYLRKMDLHLYDFEMSLRMLRRMIYLPPNNDKKGNILKCYAKLYLQSKQYDSQFFKDENAVVSLAMTAIIAEPHISDHQGAFTLQRWLATNTGGNSGDDFPKEFLEHLYNQFHDRPLDTYNPQPLPLMQGLLAQTSKFRNKQVWCEYSKEEILLFKWPITPGEPPASFPHTAWSITQLDSTRFKLTANNSNPNTSTSNNNSSSTSNNNNNNSLSSSAPGTDPTKPIILLTRCPFTCTAWCKVSERFCSHTPPQSQPQVQSPGPEPKSTTPNQAQPQPQPQPQSQTQPQPQPQPQQQTFKPTAPNIPTAKPLPPVPPSRPASSASSLMHSLSQSGLSHSPRQDAQSLSRS
ncbi:hypothetical protein Pelo_10501 [Pelomyxa schiedti]|nr:hypothetical protein Pelo_10501 [Pelomyxa schiedti]